MECFAHAGAQSVALCKVCARGVCHSCAIPVTNGFACSPEHAPLAQQLATAQTVSARNSGLYRVQRWIQPIASAALAAVGATYAYSYPSQSLGWIFLSAGLLLAGITLAAAIRRH